jgi:hypothetical protein
MFSVPDGRAANQPFAVTTFSPPIGALLPGVLAGASRDLRGQQVHENGTSPPPQKNPQKNP